MDREKPNLSGPGVVGAEGVVHDNIIGTTLKNHWNSHLGWKTMPRKRIDRVVWSPENRRSTSVKFDLTNPARISGFEIGLQYSATLNWRASS
jgi:hypothetical protein